MIYDFFVTNRFHEQRFVIIHVNGKTKIFTIEPSNIGMPCKIKTERNIQTDLRSLSRERGILSH